MAAVEEKSKLISSTQAWKDLAAHVDEISKTHLRDLLADEKRCAALVAESNGIYLDYSRQRVTERTLNLLFGK